jgi:hypothetical protein
MSVAFGIGEFALHEGETWRDVIIKITSHHPKKEETNWDGTTIMISLTDKLLKTFDDAMLRDPCGDARHAALTAFHFWGGLPSTEHTPGPWNWAKIDGSTTMLLGEGQDPCCTSILIADGCEACATRGRNCSINGNAFDLALIAAAPDLLAVCKALIKKIDWAFDSEIQGVLAEEVDAAEAAIAKAEGRP